MQRPRRSREVYSKMKSLAEEKSDEAEAARLTRKILLIAGLLSFGFFGVMGYVVFSAELPPSFSSGLVSPPPPPLSPPPPSAAVASAGVMPPTASAHKGKGLIKGKNKGKAKGKAGGVGKGAGKILRVKAKANVPVDGTVAGVGGPPMALTYQHSDPRTLRATLATFNMIGSAFTIPSLAIAGVIGRRELQLALMQIPGVLLGLWVGQFTITRLPPERVRPIVLVACGASAFVLLGRQVV